MAPDGSKSGQIGVVYLMWPLCSCSSEKYLTSDGGLQEHTPWCNSSVGGLELTAS